MKRIGTISIMIIMASMFFYPLNNDLLANVFASRLKILNPDSLEFDGNFADGSGALFTFYLNDTANTVILDIIDTQSGSSVHQIAGGGNEPWCKSNDLGWYRQ